MGSRVYLHNNDAILQCQQCSSSDYNVSRAKKGFLTSEKEILPPLGSVHSSEMRDTHGYIPTETNVG